MTVGEVEAGQTFTHHGVEYTVVDHSRGLLATGSLTRCTFQQYKREHEITFNSNTEIVP